MSQKPLSPIIILLLLLILTSVPATIGLFPDLVQGFWNLVRFKAGNLKWSRDYEQYEARELSDSLPKIEYDYVIIGAGSSGATIAARLSELRNEQVLLIEAGGHETLTMDVPLLALLLQHNRDINWDYRTEPTSKYCRAMEGNQCRLARGRVMGGTSVLNFMIAVRGNKNDYDEWYNLTGDPNWSYDGMLRSFKKLETFESYAIDADANYRNLGTDDATIGGPMRIANPPYFSPLADAFVRAGEELGLPPVDYNGRKQTGFSHVQVNQVNGERLSTNRAYLHPAKGRANLHVSMNSHATRVLIDPTTKIANGVEFVKEGRRYEALARKEVILSAGAISTPQLLMLSGIGPAAHLRAHGIDVIQDAPGVGGNLKDHVALGNLCFLVNDTLGIVLPEIFLPSNPSIADYLNDRTGHFSTAGGVEALGLVNVDDPRAVNETPNIELMFASVSPLSSLFMGKPFGIKDNYLKQFVGNNIYRHAWMIMPLLMKPKSAGRLRLRSRDPFAKPRIVANYFADPDDIRVSIKGIRLAIEVGKTKAMRRYGSQFYNSTVPGCERYYPDSDDYWECALRTFTITLWHQCGTAKMGRIDDPSAVVDTRLRVKGTKKLRVADLSIMPNIVTAHTNIPAIAIGEKFADIIKEDYGYV